MLSYRLLIPSLVGSFVVSFFFIGGCCAVLLCPFGFRSLRSFLVRSPSQNCFRVVPVCYSTRYESSDPKECRRNRWAALCPQGCLFSSSYPRKGCVFILFRKRPFSTLGHVAGAGHFQVLFVVFFVPPDYSLPLIPHQIHFPSTSIFRLFQLSYVYRVGMAESIGEVKYCATTSQGYQPYTRGDSAPARKSFTIFIFSRVKLPSRG